MSHGAGEAKASRDEGVLSGRVMELDGLRGLAIAQVVIWHYIATCLVAAPGTAGSYAVKLLSMTWTGVDLFFVLSGYLIGGILLQRRDASNYFQVFYVRRSLRILPAYYAYIGLYAVLRLLEVDQRPDVGWVLADPLPLWSYPLFLQNIFMVIRQTFGGAWFGISWSLAIEEQFYLVLPLLIRFVPLKRLPYALLAGMALAVALRQVFPNVHATALMPFRADSLFLGALLAYYLRQPAIGRTLVKHRAWLFGGLLGTLTLAGMVKLLPWNTGPFYYLVIALIYAALLVLVVTQADSWVGRIFRWRILVWLGQIAYGLYLTHSVIHSLAHVLLRGHAPALRTAADWGATGLALAIALAVSHLSFVTLEKRCIAIGHRFKYR